MQINQLWDIRIDSKLIENNFFCFILRIALCQVFVRFEFEEKQNNRKLHTYRLGWIRFWYLEQIKGSTKFMHTLWVWCDNWMPTSFLASKYRERNIFCLGWGLERHLLNIHIKMMRESNASFAIGSIKLVSLGSQKSFTQRESQQIVICTQNLKKL